MFYIVGTPIGNLEDLSYRAAVTLAKSQIILSEDTRKTGLLLAKIPELFNIEIRPDQRLVSYYKEKEFHKLAPAMESIEEGLEVALVTDAGMPLVSDPGYLLVQTVIKKGLPYEVIPGPTAVTTALVASGLNPSQFAFFGFLPKKSGERMRLITKWVEMKKLFPDMVAIVYESPERIQRTLSEIEEIMPDAHVVVARELTKTYEEIVRGTPSELKNREYKGEITLLVQ